MLKRDREELLMFKNDGDLVEDHKARKMGAQILSEALGGIAVPSREPTPCFNHVELGRRPIKTTAKHIETVDASPPEEDPLFIQQDIKSTYDNALNELEEEDEKKVVEHKVMWVFLIGAVMFLLSVGGYSMYAHGETQELRAIELERMRTEGVVITEQGLQVQTSNNVENTVETEDEVGINAQATDNAGTSQGDDGPRTSGTGQQGGIAPGVLDADGN